MSEKEKASTSAFTKEQIIESKQFSLNEKDVLYAVLEQGKTYTIEQAKSLISEYAKRKVK